MADHAIHTQKDAPGDIPPALHGTKSTNDIEVEQDIERSQAEKIANPTHNVPLEGKNVILSGPSFPKP